MIRMGIKDIPWNRLKLYFWKFRRKFFKIEVPAQHTKLVVGEDDLDALKDMFRAENFFIAWPFSYHYEGEVMNVVRPEYTDDEYEYYQLHVRGFPHKDGYVLMAHYELDPTDYPNKHIKEVNMDEPKGIAMLKKILEDNNIDYEEK